MKMHACPHCKRKFARKNPKQSWCNPCKAKQRREARPKKTPGVRLMCHCLTYLSPDGTCPSPGCTPYAAPSHLEMIDLRCARNEHREGHIDIGGGFAKQVNAAYRRIAAQYDPFYARTAAYARRGGMAKTHLMQAKSNKKQGGEQ